MKAAALFLLTLTLLVSCSAPIPQIPQQHSQQKGNTEQSIHRQINAYRQSKGLNPLANDPYLTQLARQHSADMAQGHSNGKLTISHKGFSRRAKAAMTTGMTHVAENVAAVQLYGEPAPPRLAQNWIRSKGHHKNIVGDYTVTGVGTYTTSDGAVYATQLFGKQ